MNKRESRKLSKKNLHIVLGDERQKEYARKCRTMGISMSEVGRILVDGFLDDKILINKSEATIVSGRT